MLSKVSSRISKAESQLRRLRIRRTLIESLEPRQLLASDLLACVQPAVFASLVSIAEGEAQPTTYTAIGPAQASLGPAQQLDQLLGTAAASGLTERAWFDLIEQGYARWSEENGLAFSFDAGLQAEGENGPTALDVYIAQPDPSYSFEIIAAIPGVGFTRYDVEMTSQTWRTIEETTWNQWRHRLSIVVPSVVTSGTSMLIIGGGSHGGTGGFGGGTSASELTQATALAVSTGTVVSTLSNVPYQPLRFEDEAFNRSEDSLIAKSYRLFLDGGDDHWPALLPMVKSAVRAMDTVQSVALSERGVAVNDFVVTGASKRGWTTWLTAAVDNRVSAIAPMVINVLNMDVQMQHHKQAYEGVTVGIVGGYSVAVQDYVNLGIFDDFDDPRGQELLKIVDPYEYRDRLTLPKFMINGTGDEFFVPDSDQFFVDQLLGPTHVRYLPNAGHGLGPDAAVSLSQFYRSILNNTPLPQFTSTITSTGAIRVTTTDTPIDVRLWQATNPINRDFRQSVPGTPLWTSSPLAPVTAGQYVAGVPAPATGYTAFMIELTYLVGGEPMTFTSPVSVVPTATVDAEPRGPRLLSVAPNSGQIFSFNALNTLYESPTELVLRFDDAIDIATLSGIQVIGAGKDGVFGNGNDIIVDPGWIGTGDTDRVIILRFAQPLEDDTYRIQLLADGDQAVRNVTGQVLQTRTIDSTPGDRSIESTDFRVSLGARVLGVVPQPVDRAANGSLQPQLNKIRVYFNDDDLDPTSASNPAFYQLIFTADTVHPGDDRVFVPISVTYDPAADMAELTFAGDIHTLAGPGTYRLRIGTSTAVHSINNPPSVAQLSSNNSSTVGSAQSLGTLSGDATFLISGSVITNDPSALRLDFPGSSLEPGHRNIQDERHLNGGPDSNPRISTIAYNFALNRSYGLSSDGQPLFTSITPEQMQRVREIFEFFSKTHGLDVVETASSGMTVVVGDMWPNGEVSGPGGVAGVAGGGLAIMDGAESWNNGLGGNFFNVAMHEIGHLLGHGHMYDLPAGTIMGGSSELAGPIEWSFPGDHDIVHGQHMYRPDNRDVDMYSFVVPAGRPGRLELEVLAERLPNGSNLESHLTLYKQTPSGPEIVSTNGGRFGNDAYIVFDLPAEADAVTYFVAITAMGNHDFHPQVANTGSGATSEGNYVLRVHFQPVTPTTHSIVDLDGTPLDGNGDGQPGGEFNFWFRAAAPATGIAGSAPKTIFVDKAYNGATSVGSAAQPMKNLNFNSWPLALRPQPGDIVRVAGHAPGTDLTTVPAYEFGRGGIGNQILADGIGIQIPRGVTMMVDAGAIFKSQASQITVGSLSASVDFSQSALQILGTPHQSVYFTSYLDESLGIDTNPLSTSPEPGDWAGIMFRNDFDRFSGRADRERQGVFLNYVAGADMRFGGGRATALQDTVDVSSLHLNVSPITMYESRPTVINNDIRWSADAALAADPNSFEETLFTTSRYQLAGPFNPDYSRVGPDIRGNRLHENSVNGLLVRTMTPPGQPLKTLDFSARFDDTDIVHVISENLIINSRPGGGFLEQVGPDLNLVVIQTQTGGSLPVGSSVRYILTNVDRWGHQGLPSQPTAARTVGVGGGLRLTGLPAATGDFVSRRLWRSVNGGAFELVAELDRAATAFNDLGAGTGILLGSPNATELVRGRPNARLEIAPGTIVKSNGARIEVSVGAQLIAEGTADRPIIFTSLADDRYGTGGTFDSDNNDTQTNPGGGDWAGLVARHLSSISIDQALIAHAGGLSAVSGGFSGFNAVEIHQATARIANTRFDTNASGLGGNVGATRDGRGPNDASVVYVVGSQPVLLDNIFVNNSITNTATISINANALNSVNVVDPGRQTGANGRWLVNLGNAGPLVSGNRLENNGINGMRVRGQILTTESIWDDTDIVHVLQSEIIVPDHHTYSGLTLRSRVDESLVVKLQGSNAGLTAMGRPLDITDRIGGSIRILGAPGFPVVMTSLNDDTVGAGFTPSGFPQTNTNPNGGGVGGVLPTGPQIPQGTLIDNNVPTNIPGHFSFQVGPGGSAVNSRVTVETPAGVLTNQNYIFSYLNYVDVGGNGQAISLAATTITTPPTLIGPDFVISEGNFQANGATVAWRAETWFDNGIAKLNNRVIFSSSEPLGNIRLINYLDEDVGAFTDDILYLVGTPGQPDFQAFTLDGPLRVGFSQGGVYQPTPQFLENATFTGWTADAYPLLDSNIQGAGTQYTVAGNINTDNLPAFTDPQLGLVFGPADVTTAFAWDVNPTANRAVITSFLELIARNPLSGDWRGIRFEPYANDRNVAMITELERDMPRESRANDTIQSAQYVGALANHLNGGDESLRLGMQIDGTVAIPDDVDIFRFQAISGTMVWLDIDRTAGSLNSVLELLDSDGNVVARSTNSLQESLGLSSRFVDSDRIAPEDVMGLDADPFAPRNSRATSVARDLYSTNPHDAGFRLTLPGAAGVLSNYFVRVSSDGITTGSYRLQVRLSQTDEIPGSTVSYADIRYATRGIEAFGMPGSSPLLGQMAESENRHLGNIANSDRGSVSVAGQLTVASERDYYTFTVARDSIQVIDPTLGDHMSVVLDIDYADGFGGPDTMLWVFDAVGNLHFAGTASNVADDQAAPMKGNDLADLTRGSTGRRDAFIGPLELPPGVYRVYVTNASQIPLPLLQYSSADAGAAGLTRMEPISSIQRISVDRFGGPTGGTASAPLQVSFSPDIAGNRVEWTLADVTTYVLANTPTGFGSSLHFANAFTGARVANVSQFPRVHDVAMRTDGELVGFAVPPPGAATDENAGFLLLINSTGEPGVLPEVIGDEGTGIETYTTQQTTFAPAPIQFDIQQRDQNLLDEDNIPVGDGIVFEALTFYANNPGQTLMFAVGSRGNNQTSFNTALVDPISGNVLGIGPASTYTRNIVYRINPEDGSVINANGRDDREGVERVNGVAGVDNPLNHAGTNKIEFGRFLTNGTITGLAEIGGTLFAVSNQGELFAASTNGNNAFGTIPAPISLIVDPQLGPVAFTGLTRGPAGLHEDLLFGTTADGRIYAFSTTGQLRPVFAGASYRTQTAGPNGLGTAVNGIDFSTLTSNLWQVGALPDDLPAEGHGRTIPPDGSQPENFPGGNVLRFGSGVSYDMPGGAHGAILSHPIDLSSYSSDDLPMLYFNYLLDTEGQNSDLNEDGRMRDAFRVYGAGEDGQWILLATNNTPADGGFNRLGSTDELDTSVNSNRDPYGNPVPSQELFDVGEWRQARVSLAALAGKANVRLRFEFSTAASFATGDPLRGGVEVIVVAGNKIQDGTGFTMTPVQLPGQTARNFQFEHGLVLALPGGASLINGVSSITVNGTVLTFSTASNFGNNLFYSPTDSPATIANRVSLKLIALGIANPMAITFDPQHPNTLAVANLPAGGVYAVSFMGTGVLRGTPGVTAGAVPIPINPTMTAEQVRDTIRGVLNQTFGNPQMLLDFPAQSLATWHYHDNILQLYGYSITNNNSALGVTTQRAGDRFGVDLNNPLPPLSEAELVARFANMNERALNNSGRGVFIDDIIIGFASRGEMVFNAPPTTEELRFSQNPQYRQILYGVPSIETGTYQLTIRTAADYGVVDEDTGQFSLSRDFDINERFAKAFAIEVNANAAGNIADGTTFTLTNTIRSLTFEFDVATGPTDPAFGIEQGRIPVRISPNASAEQIARAIRDAINSNTARSILGITAAVNGQRADGSGGGGRLVQLHGRVATDLAGNFSFPAASQLSAVRYGQNSVFGENLGDVERERPQGQLLLVGNTITNSADVGILLAAGDRVQPFGHNAGNPFTGVGVRPYPGSPINFPNPNRDGLAPGVVVINNVLADNANAGLQIVGDPGPDAPRQIARVINNTIFGNQAGVLIQAGATPTLLNNIVAANSQVGIVAQSGGSAILGGNLYQNNGTTLIGVSPGAFDFFLQLNDPLFVDTTNRRYYLAAGSRAIDASIEALQERAALTEVKSPLGLPLSPMLAPDVDVWGVARVDDPQVHAPPGMGANIFKDRGAVERADFIGPWAVILNPPSPIRFQEQDATNLRTYLAPEDPYWNDFTVVIQDISGTGANPATVAEQTITLTENGRLLVEGKDYVFAYQPSNRTLQLTPMSGQWRTDSVYELTLINQPGHRLVVPAGAEITDGERISLVHAGGTLILEWDADGSVLPGAIPMEFSDTLPAYALATRVAQAINIRTQSTGVRARIEGDGSLFITGAATVFTDQPDTSVLVVGPIADLAGNRLQPNRATGLTQFTIVMPDALLDFGDSGAAQIPTLLVDNGARHVLLPPDAPPLALGLFASPNLDGLPSVAADGDDYATLVNLGTLGGVRQAPVGPFRIQVPAAAGLDGQVLIIRDGVNRPFAPLRFEFDTNNVFSPAPDKVIVPLLPGDSASVVAQKLADAVFQAVLAGRLTGLIPVADGDKVSLGGSLEHQLILDAAPSVSRLSVGTAVLEFPSSAASLAHGQSMSITDALGNTLTFQLSPGVGPAQFLPSGLVLVPVVLPGMSSTQVAEALAVAIRDQVAHHRLFIGNASTFGSNLVIFGDDEDGIAFRGEFNAASNPVAVTITSTGYGMVDAWIDWNADGRFHDATERVVLLSSPDSTQTLPSSVAVRPGENVFYIRTPSQAVAGVTTARFRLSTTGGLLPYGVGIGGEVEDHVIEIVGGNPPVAVPDQYQINEDHMLVISVANSVLANDTDPDVVPPATIQPGVNIWVYDEEPGIPGIQPLVDVSHGSLVLNLDGTFTYTPNLDFNGTDFFVYRATDGRLISKQPATVTIAVNPVNDPPQFDIGPDQIVLEDAGSVSISNWATNILPGPLTALDELASQTVAFVVTTDRTDLFTLFGQPAISSQGTLTFETAPDANGIAEIRITAIDSGPSSPPNINLSAEVVATITILPVNDPPVFTPGPQVTVLEDSGPFVQPWATDIAPAAGLLAIPPRALDEAGQLLQFVTASVSNPLLFLPDGQPRLLPNGTLQFTTAPHRNGAAVVIVRLEDDGASTPQPNNNSSASRTFTITVTPVNDPPEFTLPSSVTILEDQGLVTVPGFATGIRPGPIEAVDEVNQLVQFQVEALDPNLFTVQPSMLPNGALSFHVAPNVNSANVALDGRSLEVRVRLIDDGPSGPPPNNNTSNWQTFTVNVTPVNDPPQSPDFVAQTNEDTPLTLLASEILANASGGPTSDEASQRVWITQVQTTSARGGSVAAEFNGAGTEVVSVTYVPPPNAVGTDSFVFIMRDDGVPSLQGTARVVIQIGAVNDPPQFDRGPNQTVSEDAGPIVVENWATNVLPGPSSAIDELESQTVSFELVVDRPELFIPDGQPTLSGDGTLTFQTALDANGVAIVRVVAVDDGPSNPPNNNRSAEVLLTITILPVNDPPVFTAGSDIVVEEDSGFYSQPWATNIAPAAGLLAVPPRALDEASQAVSFVVQADRPELFVIQPAVSSSGVLSFQPAPNAFGSTQLTVTAIDNGPSGGLNQNISGSVAIILTILAVNDPPVAVDDHYSTDENSLLQIAAPGVLANDFDVDMPDDQIFALADTLDSALGAVVVLNQDGSFSYDPREVLSIQQLTTGQWVVDTFVYWIQDMEGAVSNPATVTITVQGVDDPPVAIADYFVIPIGQTILLDVLSNDFDIDTAIDPSSIELTTLPIFGNLTVRPDGLIEYVPPPAFSGTNVFHYTVRDIGGNRSNEATVTIVAQDPPLAMSDLAFTFKNEPVLIPVLHNDLASANPIDPASVRINTPPNSGVALIQADGSVLYTPEADFAGEVTFTYIVSDSLGLSSSPATVLVRVQNSRWQNPSMNMDVNADGRISAIDALLIINYLNTDQPRFLPDAGILPPPYLDVNGDERVSALDALLIINYLNTRSAGGGSEGEASAASVELAMMVTPQQMINSVGPQVVQQVEQALEQERLRALAVASPHLAEIDGGPLKPLAGNSSAAGSSSGQSLEDLVQLLSHGSPQSDEVNELAFDEFFEELDVG